MMDFEAEAKEAAKGSGLESDKTFLFMLSKAMGFGFVKGRDSMKKECIEVANSEFSPAQIVKEIKKL